MSIRSVTFALTAAVSLLALSGCVVAPPGGTTTPPRIVTTDIPEVSGMEALMTATLSVDDDGCVIAQLRDGVATIVWPKGYTTSGSDDSFEVLDATGEAIAPSGVLLKIGGGNVDTAVSEWVNVACATNPLWMFGGVSEP
jgi:hypothetical protein